MANPWDGDKFDPLTHLIASLKSSSEAAGPEAWFNSFDAMMGGGARPSFTGPGGSDPAEHFRRTIMIGTQPTVEDLTKAGLYLRNAIRDRSFGGLSVERTAFAPYSPAYAKQKGQTNVDLYSRGASRHMQDALTVRVSPDATDIELGIFGDSQVAMRARVHNEGAMIPTRQGKGKRIITEKKVSFKAHGKQVSFTSGSRWAGLGIAHQKRGGHTSMTMPRRHWLGANKEDIDGMTNIILGSIQQRLQAK